MFGDGNSFVRGEFLEVSIPDEQHSDKKVQRSRNIIKSQKIKHVLVLSGHNGNSYLVSPCKETNSKKSVHFQIGQIDYYASIVQVLTIDGDVLKRVSNSFLSNRDAVLQEIESLHTAYLQKREEKKKRKANSTTSVHRPQLSNPPTLRSITSRKIQYNSSNVVCPKCRELIPTAECYVYIEGQGLPTLRVGYCSKCSVFYSPSDKVYPRNGELYGKPVIYSNLRYRDGSGEKVRFKTINRGSHDSYEQTIFEKKTISNKQPDKKRTKAEIRWEAAPYSQLLLQLPVVGDRDRKCPICNHAPDGMKRTNYLTYDEHGKSQKSIEFARYCSSCDIVFFDAGQEREIRRRAGNNQVFTLDAFKYSTAASLIDAALSEPKKAVLNTAAHSFPFDFDDASRPNLSFEQKAILVYKKKCHCKNCLNKYGVETIRNRTAIVKTVHEEEVQINVMYCVGCGRYYMNYSSFEQYQKIYGGLLLEYRFTGELLDKNSSFLNMAPDSILSRCGYSVQAGVSKEYRQAVLRYIMETKKASKHQIIELITNFITLRDYNPVFSGACERWREDLLYVNQYRIGAQKKVYGLTFKQGK